MSGAPDWAQHYAAEKADLLRLLAGLRGQDWDRPSLCPGWRVRDVAAHLVVASRLPRWRFVAESLRGGAPRATRVLAVRYADARSNAELLAELRRWGHGTSDAGIYGVLPLGERLLEVFVHRRDIARPLDRRPSSPPERLGAALEAAVRLGGLAKSKQRARGLRLVGSDLDAMYGDGPAVHGPTGALVLALAGRADALVELTGDGVAVLATRA